MPNILALVHLGYRRISEQFLAAQNLTRGSLMDINAYIKVVHSFPEILLSHDSQRFQILVLCVSPAKDISSFFHFFEGTIRVRCDFIQQSTSYVHFLVQYWIFRVHYDGAVLNGKHFFSGKKRSTAKTT